MKTQKVFHLVVLLTVAVAPLFFPTPAEAGDPAIPYIYIDGLVSLKGSSGKYNRVDWVAHFCDGTTDSFFISNATPFGFDKNYGKIIKEYTAVFSSTTLPESETIYGCSGECGCTGKSKKVSTCGGFFIASRVPRSPAVPVSFKGPRNITSAKIYFKNLKYSLSLWLHRYEGGRWYGYLNTLLLPLGKHHGRVTTYVDGVRGGGCATGGFKVVEE
jgi:hypothetical protein